MVTVTDHDIDNPDKRQTITCKVLYIFGSCTEGRNSTQLQYFKKNKVFILLRQCIWQTVIPGDDYLSLPYSKINLRNLQQNDYSKEVLFYVYIYTQRMVFHLLFEF